MSKKIGIFVQASADIIHARTIINNHLNNDDNVTVFIANSISFLKQVKSLNLDIKIKYIDVNISFDPKKIWKYNKSRNIIESYWNKELNQSFDKIYFFSIYEDYLTAIWVSKFSKTSKKIEYYNHYDDLTIKDLKRSWSLKLLLYSVIYTFVFRTNFSNFYSSKFPRFNYSKYSKIRRNDVKLMNFQNPVDEKFQAPSFEGYKTILFFYSDSQNNKQEREQLVFINKIDKSKFKILFKSHPRIKTKKIFKDYIDIEIPNHVSAEFIDYTNIDYCVGLSTAALCFPARLNLSEVFSFSEKNRIYLDEFSDKKIKYKGFDKFFN